MSNYEVIQKDAISGIEVLDEITKKSEERELTYREEKTLEYLKQNTKLSLKDFQKAKDELLGLDLARIEEEHIIKILDLMPTNGTELRAIVSHSGTVLVDESVDSILNILKKYK